MFREAIILIAFLFFCVNSQTYPNQNCPVFQYDRQNGFTVGRVELPNDFSGDYRISINMTVAAYLIQREKINIQLQTETSDIRNGSPLVYFVIFPIQNVLLKPTRIEFNRQVYCTGPPEPITPGRGITNFWATSILGTGGPISRPPSRQPPVIFTLPPPISPTNPTYPTYPTLPPNTIRTTSMVTQTSSMRPTPSVVVPYSSDCGFNSVASSIPLIANGTNVVDRQYPWLAAIMYQIKGSSTNEHKFHCTGSLVSHKHVITAAHCVQYGKSLLAQKEEVLILLGIVDIDGWLANTESTVARVSDIKVHPDFNSTNGDSDIAVFTLKENIKFTPYVRPICIWNEGEDLKLVEEQLGSVAGWGSDKSGKAKIEIAAYVDMPIVSQVKCLRSNSKFRRNTSSRTFCAGKRDGSGPCNGDSGGPFMLERGGRWTLRGLVSRSLSDDVNQCDVYNYFIFADIAKARDWLDGVLI